MTATVSIAPEGVDPLTAAGWTDIGWVDADDLQFAGDDDTQFSCDDAGPRTWSATVEFPKVSREAIMLAMGQDPSEIPAHVPRDWRGRTVADIMRDILSVPVVESSWVPPGQVLIGTPRMPVRVWPPEPHERDWWQDGMWAYRAAERIAMSVQRHDLTASFSKPAIGYAPRKAPGLTGRRYRAARRAHARQRRAWVKAGSPTVASRIYMPSVVLTGVGIA